MQIDFHHALTYVAARCGGLPAAQAAVVAHAAQYVDDATNEGVVRFDDGGAYARIASAHKHLDYRNLDRLAQARVWVPFHFMPGNGGLPAGQGGHLPRDERLVTTPDSHLARDLVRLAIRDRGRPWALHRFGITMHTYADTWAHQGFSGVSSELNGVDELAPEPEDDLRDWAERVLQKLQGFFVESALPLGHGTVLSYPDQPFLRWTYVDARGRRVERDNPTDFLAAANAVCRWTRCLVEGRTDGDAPPLTDRDQAEIDALLRGTRDPSGEARHATWLAAVADGRFSFGAEGLVYVAKGDGSWKHEAIGTREAVDTGDEVFPFRPGFLRSDWKLFHDALQEQRLVVLNELLPAYGLCAA